MTHAALTSLLDPEFDDFLYASIDEDRNGKLLSVLSALARLDVDPWREAAKLARLPKETATQRLAALIAALPDESSAHRPAGTIAARLIALLPRRADPTVQFRKTSLRAGAMASPRPIASIVALVLMLIALSGLLTRPSPPKGNAQPSAVSSIRAVSPPPPPTAPGVL